MFRSVLRRSSPLPLVGGVAGAHGRSYAKVRTTEVVTGFDAAWRAMGKEERDKIIKEYAAYEAQDWHSLSLEQKRAIYTIAYGAPAEVDPYEGYKVLGGVVAVMVAGLGAFAFARSKANPPLKTMSPEWQRAQEEYLRSQRGNPIFGISSTKEPSAESVDIV